MCVHFNLKVQEGRLVSVFKITGKSRQLNWQTDLFPGYNAVTVVREKTVNTLAVLKWGLIPSWVKDPEKAKEISKKTFNARGETLSEKPSFRGPFQSQRCLIPASSFFETRKKDKRKFQISVKDRDLFAFAGLWDKWTLPGQPPVVSCTMVTIAPNKAIEPIHNRMPVILEKSQEEVWLDPQAQEKDLKNVIRPFAAEKTDIKDITPPPQQGSLF